MAEMNVNKTSRRMIIHHRGRGAQVWIYLGKMLRMFVYQSDWKVLPMAALIAGLVGMVIRNRLFVTMEGSLMGGFALVMVCIWNGCFNSIQVVCRERDVIKREHRSGMHITSYVMSHMIYQALLCAAQTGVTLYVTRMVGVRYPVEGLFTDWMIVDFGISMFLITFASDMLSLWVSSLSRTTTTAMTIMPFVLIFQLVFSGGMLNLPAWTEAFTPFTISNPALKVIVAQSDYNARPVMTVWDQVNRMRDREISETITVDHLLNLAQNESVAAVANLRQMKIEDINIKPLLESLGITDGSETMQTLLNSAKAQGIEVPETVGELVDEVIASQEVQSLRGKSYTLKGTVDDIIKIIGEERVRDTLQNKIGENSQNADYANTKANIAVYWVRLALFALAFAALATITLEFIDKDKR